MKPPLLLSATVLLGLVPHCLAENLVSNAGFEQEFEGWKVFLPGNAEYEPLVCEIVSSNPHEGASAVVMNSTVPLRWALTMKDPISVEPGDKFRIEAWVRVDPNATIEPKLPGLYASYWFADSAWEQIGKEDPSSPGTFFGLWDGMARWDDLKNLAPDKLPGKWTKISAVVQAPPDAKLLKFSINVWGITGKVYWDDISVERVDAFTLVTKTL